MIEKKDVDLFAGAVAKKIHEYLGGGTVNFYKHMVQSELLLILLLCVCIGGLGEYVRHKAIQVKVMEQTLEEVKRDKDLYTQRAETAERTLAIMQQSSVESSKKLKALSLDSLVIKYAEKLFVKCAEEGSNKYNKKFAHLKKVVKIVMEIQKYFPNVAKTGKQRIDTALSIGCVETGLDPTIVGDDGEKSIWQLMPGEIPRLMKMARKRGFDVSSDVTDIRTSCILMYLHLGEKMHDNKDSWDEGIRRYNGNWRANPTYWLRFLRYYHCFDGIDVDEKILPREGS